jgi:hypothetical protein
MNHSTTSANLISARTNNVGIRMDPVTPVYDAATSSAVRTNRINPIRTYSLGLGCAEPCAAPA